MLRSHFLIAIASVCLLSASPALAKPDFSGSWKIVMDKSDFGPLPPPEKLEQVVDHKESDVKVALTQVGQQGEVKVEFNYSTEHETENKFRNALMKSNAKWDGDKLVVVSKMELQGNEIVLQDTWSLADEGKTLVLDRKFASPQGEIEMKHVFTRQ